MTWQYARENQPADALDAFRRSSELNTSSILVRQRKEELEEESQRWSKGPGLWKRPKEEMIETPLSLTTNKAHPSQWSDNIHLKPILPKVDPEDPIQGIDG
jgi:hypothetical protein